MSRNSAPKLQPPAASGAEEPFTAVETTNFNAVKALIFKYGLNVDPSLTRQDAEDAADLGAGSPYVITSQKLAGGRTVWRFTTRIPSDSVAATYHASSSTSSLGSGSQFEDRDGNRLQGGDVLGAVLGTHPCFPSLHQTSVHPHVSRQEEDAENRNGSISGSPFGPAVDFYPMNRRDWGEVRRRRSSSACESDEPAEAAETSEGVSRAGGGAETSILATFDLLQTAAPGEIQTESTPGHNASLPETDTELSDAEKGPQSASANASGAGRKRSRLHCFADDPRFAVWGAPVGGKRKIIVQTSGPSDGVVESLDSALDGSPFKARCLSAPLDRSPLRIGALSMEEAETFPPLREYQHAALFPKQSASLLAASLERIVIQLTTLMDSRLHIEFFYAYRNVCTAQDLLDLLLLRFDWSLEETPLESDAQLRSVVRVRTYVVLKFWLTHFFEEDFLPNKALRASLTAWLNAFGDLSRLDTAQAGVISSLRKTVMRLKQHYTRSGVSGLLQTSEPPEPSTVGDTSGAGLPTSTSTGSIAESTVDLELSADISGSPADGIALPSFNAIRPNHQSSSHHDARSSSALTGMGSLSKALSHTVNRLQKIKLVGPSRKSTMPSTTVTSPMSGEGSTQDRGDLLFVKGGLENFLDYFHIGSTSGEGAGISSPAASDLSLDVHTPSLSLSPALSRSTPASSLDLPAPLLDDEEPLPVPSAAFVQDRIGTSRLKVDHENSGDNLHHTTSEQTLRSPTRKLPGIVQGSSGSLRLQADSAELTGGSNDQAPGIVQIDDIDLSSDEDDDAVRKALRRLPGARDLRLARKAFGSIQSRPYARTIDTTFSSNGDAHSQSHGRVSTIDDGKDHVNALGYLTTELFDPDEALAGYELVKGFDLEGFESDEDEPGDAEAALRKLEGYIDEEKRKDRARRVEALWNKSRSGRPPVESNSANEIAALLNNAKALSNQGSGSDMEAKAASSQPRHSSMHDGEEGRQSSSEKPKDSEADETSFPGPEGSNVSEKRPPLSKPERWAFPPLHRSFLLDYRSDAIASQMSLIEAELFSHITWQEIATGTWRDFRQRSEISDWEEFYRLRMREKALAEQEAVRWTGNGFGVVVARFNLVANWVVSEVILTQDLTERAAVISKFIRVAWKCYQMANFASMTQIVFGLQSPWVERLRRTWARVAPWELRILRDLRALTSPTRNFRHMRRVMDIMIAEEGMEEFVNSVGPPDVFASSAAPPAPASAKGCIPFCGLFLMDLMENDILPTWISATTLLQHDCDDTLQPHESSPGLPFIRPPLQVKPMVNVLKLRVLAMTIKTIIAFQQRARTFSMNAEGALYLRCLKLRSLPSSLMTTLSGMAEP